ncbi:FAD-dependent oxidoreductase [Nocardia neocaledoniensis]|uniref:FAD-dependent oxidoreductase n=1 Tax=Nocardia neocaledoniensis TaxID=236511 RepID=UPI0024587495|nr:FAD-dependent oxidoreductase [Nocardia neocaledoniensis]
MSVHESTEPIWARAGEDRTVDIVVLGMGAAGCAAAIEAHDAGARVLILEKTDAEHAGGNTRVSGGAWFHHDNPTRAATYLRALCGDRAVPESIAQTWAEHTQSVSEWVEYLGATVAPVGDYGAEYPELDGSDCYGGYRGVDGILGDRRLFDRLVTALADREIEIAYSTPGHELIIDPDSGAVSGVITAAGARIGARRGVVLATGGFEGSPEMIREHLGMTDVAVWGSTAATGDGHRMARTAGADFWHMDNMMAVNGIRPPGDRHGFFAMFGSARGFIWVDENGNRFVDECVPAGHGQARINGRYELHPYRPMHVIFDERTRAAGPISPSADIMPVGWKVLMDRYRWSADNQAEIDRGWIHRADTPAELAALLGVPSGVLASTIDRYNSACSNGFDDLWGRRPDTLVALDQPPFYAYTAGPLLAWTNGGPRRDERSRVLDRSGVVIPGLYAAGTVSSTYSWSKDGGFHIADAIAFGRIAGRDAAARQ